MALHGEQYLELAAPLPSLSASLECIPRILDIKDKKKTAMLVVETKCIDQESGKVVAVNETTSIVRGAGGFGKTPFIRHGRSSFTSCSPRMTGSLLGHAHD